ncbi:MAG: hypothetical protein JWQ46_160 [Phenylobacterium sp.]|jgi:hypothetical protein|nr:hypothetical protein [Phenylobacterium sp.]MDB5465398.1 hypothetical protein [Phenylobacterium sp.]
MAGGEMDAMRAEASHIIQRLDLGPGLRREERMG